MAEIGRPTVMTAETIDKLEQAFLNGASDKEACFIAGIGDRTLYDYCQANPDFSQRKAALKDMLKYQARVNVAESIRDKKDLSLSQWYLERKAKDEFSTKTEVEENSKVIYEIKRGSDLSPTLEPKENSGPQSEIQSS